MRQTRCAIFLFCILFSVLSTPYASSALVHDFDISYYRYLNTAIVKNPDASKIEEIIRYWADAIYEASNGLEHLGTVRIFQGPSSFLSAYRLSDIVWEKAGHPKAAYGAYGSYDAQKPLGFRMAMFDGFKEYGSGTAICDFLAPEHRMYAGYALASLSSYYIHDLREEYAIERGGKKYNALAYPSILNDVSLAAYAGDLRALNHSTPRLYADAPSTVQKAKWGISAWEYLTKRRAFSAQLAPVPPKNKRDASLNESEYRFLIQPGKHNAEAQSRLRIVWVSSPVFQIVIDRSGSMEGERIVKAKNAAKDFVRSLQPGVRVGVIVFDDAVNVVSPIVAIGSGDAEKKKLYSAIDGISLGGATAIYDACAVASKEMTADRNSYFEGRYVVLFTDGEDNRSKIGVAPLIQALRKENVSVLVMGLEDEVREKTLREIASGTKGYYMMTADPLDTQEMLYGYLNSAFESQISTFDATLPAGGSTRTAFAVEEGTELLRVSLVSDGEISPKTLVFSATPPKGKASAALHDKETGKLEILQKKPAAGKWTVTLKNNSKGTRRVRISAFSRTQSRTLYLGNALTVRGGEANSAVIYASLTGNVTPHTGIGIKGTLRYPSGKNVPLEFQDMGYGPDATQGDGVYSALAENCSEPGNYRVTVAFSNTGQAVETNQRYAFLPPPGIKDGEAYVVAEKGHALPHKLERVVATTFQIEGGKVTDDSRGIIAREKPIDFERVKSYLERGEKALKRGAYDDAEDYAKSVLRMDPNNAAAYRLIGEAKDARNDFAGAVEPYAKAVELEPGEPSHYFKLGQALANIRALDEAKKIYSIMQQAFPNNKWTNQLEMAIRFMSR